MFLRVKVVLGLKQEECILSKLVSVPEESRAVERDAMAAAHKRE